jgi:hypothetical protein
MDVLRQSSDKLYDEWSQKGEAKCQKVADGEEEAVLKVPWKKMQRILWERGDPKLRHDLNLIETHVKKVKEVFHGTIGKGNEFTSQKIEARQDKIRSVSKLFHSGPSLSEMQYVTEEETIRTLCASLAYLIDCDGRASYNFTKKWSRFAFTVAFQDLCNIKARSTGKYNTVVSPIHDSMKIPLFLLKE